MWSSRNLRVAAVLIPLAIILVLGVRDFGGAFFEKRKLGEAAFEGTKFAKAYGFDAGKIATTAQSATKILGVSVASERPCGCGTSTAATLAACDAACPDGSTWSQPYIVVTTAACYSPALSWPGLSYCSSGNSQCVAAGCTPGQILLTAQSLTLQ